jgi:hypothetical protein
MPITAVQFEFLALDEETRRDVRAVHAFLKANPTLAYSPEEVAEAVGQDPHLVGHMLEKFDDLDIVERGSKGHLRYFRYLADLPEID